MPDRLHKDLINAKALARLLEEQYKTLRTRKAEQVPKNGDASNDAANGVEQAEQDVTMSENVIDEEDPEPREMGSEAVERRMQKLVDEMREQGVLDGLDENVIDLKQVRLSVSSVFGTDWLIVPIYQTVVSLDLYLAYLRAAFHTCYYCACINDNIEELQRKCVKHLRKPLSKMLLQELKVAEAEKAEKADKTQTAEGDGEQEQEQDKPKDKDTSAKDKSNENRDWKRNGRCCLISCCFKNLVLAISDERWLDWLDSKIALLINRDGVDPKEYGGRSYDECVFFSKRRSHISCCIVS